MSTTPSGLAAYRLLGRSGLRVSPLCLGAGTFGQAWGPGWAIDKPVARRLLDRYVELGGNFIDTANGYHKGESEAWLGEMLQERGDRDRLVLATKFTFGTREGDPNGGGNGRKHIVEALEASLRRLKTEHVDLYYLHAWDLLTPVEEVMATLDRLVQQGKVRYVGMSNVPGWYLGRAQTLAQWRGWEPIAALQAEYSLITRETEREYVPAARALGIGLCPWSPLANGLLTGKYRKGAGGKLEGDGRLGKGGFATGVNSDLRERNAAIVDMVVTVAKELGRTPAQVAVRWVTDRPAVSSTVIGATKLEQLDDLVKALDGELPVEARDALDAASALTPQYPDGFFTPEMQANVRNQTKIAPTTY
jgi:aryl-alcohol dehydrogenase-like predicted oxidoreductase